MKGIKKRLAVILLFLAVALTAAAQDLDVSGHWTATWNDKDNVCKALMLKTSGHQITGTFTDQNHTEWQIQNGKLEGNVLRPPIERMATLQACT